MLDPFAQVWACPFDARPFFLVFEKDIFGKFRFNTYAFGSTFNKTIITSILY